MLRLKYLWTPVGLLVITTLMLAACQPNPKSAVIYRGGPVTYCS
jgi:hypothetical protein